MCSCGNPIYCKGECKKCYKRSHYLKNREKVCERHKQQRKADPEKFKERDHKKYLKRKEQVYATSKKWVQANPDRYRNWKREYQRRRRAEIRAARPVPTQAEIDAAKAERKRLQLERNRAKARIWRQSPEGKLQKRMDVAKRRAQKKNAQPAWVDTSALREIYKNCPKGYEVDHIVPLQGKGVCGLHVPWNLQYLTRSENAKKSAKLLPELTRLETIPLTLENKIAS